MLIALLLFALLLKSALDPLCDLYRIRRSEKRLRITIHNGQEGWNGTDTTVSRRIIILVNVAFIPLDFVT